MPKFINEVSKFRHRGFKPADGGPVVMVFGNDAAPLNPDSSPMEMLWSHMVTNVVTVSDFVEEAGTVSDPHP